MTDIERAIESKSAAGPRARAWRRGGAARTLALKLVVGLTTIWLASVVVFAAVEVLPQDPARAALGLDSSAAQRAAFRAAHGLNDPAVIRYLRWAGGIIRGDFGSSIVSGRPIAEELWPRFYYTAILALCAVALSVIVALPLALVAARRPGGPFDATANLLTLTLHAVPEFALGLVLAWLLAAKFALLPLVSTGIQDGDLSALVLPVLTLGLLGISYVYRFSRLGVIEAGQAPFVRSAALRGVSPRRVTIHHVLPVASSAVINVVALQVVYLLGGVVVVENVFSYPGLGTLLITGVENNDLPVIEAVAVVISALLVVINMFADSVVVLLNPRMRGGSR
ncbi:ABC transporter permease [Streptomyces sp. NPDC017964]|uniref:ABC transporter permease n=1 Tax=Streptomyces sp. NPDC017964 TaxID=3365022 RepID=UPI0037B97413